MPTATAIAPTPESPTAAPTVEPIHPDTITVGTETVNVTVAEGSAKAPTIAVPTEVSPAVYIKSGETWAPVDLAHMETTWPQDVKDAIPTLLAAEAASDRAMADSAPDAEWHEDSSYKRNEILQILKASGIDVNQFSLEGKTDVEVMKINDSLLDTWATWNEQRGIALASVPESLIAAVVNYPPNYWVVGHYGENHMTFGRNPRGDSTEEDLKNNTEIIMKRFTSRGETFTINPVALVPFDGKHRLLLHRIGYSADNLIDVVGLENGRNALIVLMPKDSTTIKGDLCLSPVVIGQG